VGAGARGTGSSPVEKSWTINSTRPGKGVERPRERGLPGGAQKTVMGGREIASHNNEIYRIGQHHSIRFGAATHPGEKLWERGRQTLPVAVLFIVLKGGRVSDPQQEKRN